MRERKKQKDNDSQDKLGVSVNLGGIQGIFQGLTNLIQTLEKMDSSGQSEISRKGNLKGLSKDGLKGVYGFSVKLGGCGSPVVEKFGNIKESDDGPVIEEVREPITDLFVEETHVLVVAELPGVTEGEIVVELKKDALLISAMSQGVPGRKYAKEVLLSVPIDPNSLVKHYNNGILEVKLARV
ncbi:HSP20 family protein, partial [Sporomusaceae bacterium BoRhaA]|uniref:archaeal heat shock protein Hsp20 n=1 Tax=Pelorhabdus rhamnosifermentans TaxID=2772457 RepID=UPI001C062551